MSQPLPKPIHGAAGEETDLGGGEHHPAYDAAGDEDEQEGQQPGKQCYPAEIGYSSWQQDILFINSSLQASSTQSSIGASQGPLFGARAHFRMTGKSIIRRQKNRDIDRTELDRFSTGRVRIILLRKKMAWNCSPRNSVVNHILVARNVRLTIMNVLRVTRDLSFFHSASCSRSLARYPLPYFSHFSRLRPRCTSAEIRTSLRT